MTRLVEITIPAQTLAKARDGDDAARAQLYAELAPATFGLIRRMVGARPVAEDLFQETMLSFYQHLPTFRGEAPLGAWLRQIALSKCLMHLRSPWHRARAALQPLEMDAPMGNDITALAITGPAVESLDVERALGTLTATARAVVWLFEVEGYSHEEIARAFGRSVSFSKSQLARAHRKLREWYEPHEERQPCLPA